MYSGGSGSSVSLQKYNKSLLGKRKTKKREYVYYATSKKNKIETKEISSLELNRLKKAIRLKAKRKKTKDQIITLLCLGLTILFSYAFYIFIVNHSYA